MCLNNQKRSITYCEGQEASELSSAKDGQEEACGCVEGVLLKLEEEEVKEGRAVEACLAEDKEDKGEEQDLIVWEEVIKE